MTVEGVTAIVLAGGRSSRFGRDKLVEPIDGRPMLHLAIDAVRPLADAVLVVTAPGFQPLVPDGVRIVHDPEAFGGPLAGLLAGLDAGTSPVVLVAAGDMPELVFQVGQTLLAEVVERGAAAAVLEEQGRLRPLPMALRREPARAAARRLIDAGERRLRALPEALAASVIPEATWRSLDPDARSLRDIDTIADLP